MTLQLVGDFMEHNRELVQREELIRVEKEVVLLYKGDQLMTSCIHAEQAVRTACTMTLPTVCVIKLFFKKIHNCAVVTEHSDLQEDRLSTL